MIKLAKLMELHDVCINHPYRVHKVGSLRSYAEALEEMGTEFIKITKKQFKEKGIEYRECPIGMGWAHQFFRMTDCLKYGETREETRPYYRNKIREYLSLAEYPYLHTVHSYIRNSGELLEYGIHVGYMEEETSREDFIRNPLRILMYVWYPSLKIYDFNKITAKRELEEFDYEGRQKRFIQNYLSGKDLNEEYRKKNVKRITEDVERIKKIAEGKLKAGV
jgi:hypothetical protein